MGFPGGSDGKESTEMWETWVLSWDRKIPGGRHGNPLQDSCLENPHGQRSLEGYSPWGCQESDMTEQLSTAHTFETIKKKKKVICLDTLLHEPKLMYSL